MATRTLGHLALYYVPGLEEPARTLLRDLGLSLVDNGPPGFCSALLDEDSANHHDNLLYLAQMTDAHWALEQKLREQLRGGEAADAYLEQIGMWPEVAPHFGVKFQSLETLEETLRTLERDIAPGGPLHGHAQLRKFRARPGLDTEVDARMAASPAFTGDEHTAFADHIIQCFVRTDLFGLLSSAATIELDYAFGPFFQRVPTFA
ncbi:hypothetical protein [Pseudofrankia sp. DC12]|uniref:hypothetical protein n=1 Tax=Pseudofrankia sp. DC12 TaxID=683315 RepID=UPI000B24B0D1|nr:hypothetical protein [Pseudofrankia sp. DC12]